MEPATRNMPITIVEEECYEDLNVSKATTTTSNYSKVGVKNKRGLLDCLQEYGVQDMSAKRLIVTETTGAEKDSATVTETEDATCPAPRGTPSSGTWTGCS